MELDLDELRAYCTVKVPMDSNINGAFFSMDEEKKKVDVKLGTLALKTVGPMRIESHWADTPHYNVRVSWAIGQETTNTPT